NELEKLMYENFKYVGAPQYDESEIEFASKLKQTYDYIPDELPGSGTNLNSEVKSQVEKMYNSGNKVINDFIIPHVTNDYRSPGSTDVGDVSWLTPTAQIRVVCYPHNSPGHSWQNVSCGVTSIADKGLITAGKVIAGTAIDIFEDPSLLEKAKEEFVERAKEGYTCPIPEGVVPIVPGN
ncbi:MAG: amidohydrolase, partial [Ruminococcaceae bacterium]|nr:amidohydrolase [Oscillospiraceae bacterium]